VRFARDVLLWSAALTTGCYSGLFDPTDLPVGEDPAGDDDDDGAVDDGNDDDDDDDDVFGCEDAEPQTIPLRRLSKLQYANTVADLVALAYPDDPDTILAEVQPEIDQLPDDVRVRDASDFRGGMRQLDQAVHQLHVDQTYEIGRALGAELTAPERIAEVVGACATDAETSNDDACVEDFIRRFGQWTHRRPLTDEDVDFYRSVFDAEGVTQGMDPEAFADVVHTMLASPYFLYMVEHGADGDDETVVALDDYELATRLSYHFWQSMPDPALLDTAAAGELSTDEGYEAQVERLFASSKTRAAVGELYRSWLWLDDLPDMSALVGTEKFDAFLDGLTPTAETTRNMQDELLDMALYYTFDAEGGIADLLTSDRVFPRTDDLAALYGVAPWDGSGEPPTSGEPERRGIMTRAALLATGSANSHPVIRGVFVRRALLCDPLPPPPPDAETQVPSGGAGTSTRQVIENLTESEAVCAGCHATLINPLGFALEGFDAIGRFRTEERILDEGGALLDTVPIDSSVVPYAAFDDEREVSGAAELATALVDSGKVEACFARTYVRFTFARSEHLEQDACLLEGLTDIARTGSIADTLRSIAMTTAFRNRTYGE